MEICHRKMGVSGGNVCRNLLVLGDLSICPRALEAFLNSRQAFHLDRQEEPWSLHACMRTRFDVRKTLGNGKSHKPNGPKTI